MATRSRGVGGRPTKFTSEFREIFLEYVETYGRTGLASDLCGVDESTTISYRNHNPEFSKEVRAARARYIASRAQELQKHQEARGGATAILRDLACISKEFRQPATLELSGAVEHEHSHRLLVARLAQLPTEELERQIRERLSGLSGEVPRLPDADNGGT